MDNRCKGDGSPEKFIDPPRYRKSLMDVSVEGGNSRFSISISDRSCKHAAMHLRYKPIQRRLFLQVHQNSTMSNNVTTHRNDGIIGHSVIQRMGKGNRRMCSVSAA